MTEEKQKDAGVPCTCCPHHRRAAKLWRPKQVDEIAGMGKTLRKQLIKEGKFPKPIPLNDAGTAEAFLDHEIALWQAERVAKRDDASAASATPPVARIKKIKLRPPAQPSAK